MGKLAAAVATAAFLAIAPTADAAVVTDSFTGTDGTLLQNHVGEVGASWTKHSAYPADLALFGGRAQGPEWAMYHASGIPSGNEYDVQADITVKSNVGATGVIARSDTATESFYLARYNAATAAWELDNCTNPTPGCVVLGSFAQTLTVGQTYTLKLEVRNAQKKLFVNGVQRASSMDNAITRVGRVGVRQGPGSGSTTTGYHLDNFSVTMPSADTTITAGPSGPTNNASPTFSFTSTPTGGTFECKLDGPGATVGTWAACTSPKAYASLAQGAYTFNVRATVGGVTDPTPATRSFTVDTTAPDTTITSGPTGTITVNSASFGFSSEAGATFQCKLDGPGTTTGTYAACTSPKSYASLANGSYTFSVRATDTAGNVDPTPATRAFTVNVPAGVCNQTASPGGPITTPNGLISALSAGQTGCFRAGTYGDPATEITVNKDVTLMSYPGERATLKGRIVVTGPGSGATIQDFTLNGVNSGNLPTPTINGTDVTIAHNDISNRDPANPGTSAGICVSPATWNGARGDRFIIERNRIHDCGRLPRTNHDHGIYVTDAHDGIIRNNAIYDNADRGIQLYPDAQSTTIYNNTIDGNATGIIISVTSANNVIYDNIISNSQRFNVEQDSLTGTGNVVRDNCLWASTGDPYFDQNGGLDPLLTPETTLSNNSVQNPNYVNRAGKDFRDQNAACTGKGAPDDVATP
jgi:parallel beta-helix repeat protein